MLSVFPWEHALVAATLSVNQILKKLTATPEGIVTSLSFATCPWSLSRSICPFLCIATIYLFFHFLSYFICFSICLCGILHPCVSLVCGGEMGVFLYSRIPWSWYKIYFILFRKSFLRYTAYFCWICLLLSLAHLHQFISVIQTYKNFNHIFTLPSDSSLL